MTCDLVADPERAVRSLGCIRKIVCTAVIRAPRETVGMVLPREIAYLGAISARSRRCEGDVVRSGSEMIHNKQKHRLFYREISRYKTVVQEPLGYAPDTVTSPMISQEMRAHPL